MREDQRSGCPINLTLEVVGDKWSLLIIRDMIFGNRRHFRELLTRSEEGIASNILADRLKTLVEQGIITKADDPSHQAEGDLQPVRKRYRAAAGVGADVGLGPQITSGDRGAQHPRTTAGGGGAEAVEGVHGRTAGDPSGRIASGPAKIRSHVSRGQIAGGVRSGRRQAQDVGAASLTPRGRWLVTRPSQAQW